MAYTTGSAERDKFLRRAIGEVIACHEQMTLEVVAAEHLPKDFELEADELSGMLDDMTHGDDAPDEPPQVERVPPRKALMIDKSPHGAPLPPETLEKIEPPRAPEAEPPHIDAADEAPQPEIRMTAQEANQAILKAQNRLGNARIKINVTRDATAKARAKLADAITEWQSGAKPYTREALVRDHIRASNEARAQRVAQGIPPQVKAVGRSAIDRSAAYSKDYSAEGAARSRMQVGARRGAFPSSMKFQQNFDPKRGAVAKLPVKA